MTNFLILREQSVQTNPLARLATSRLANYNIFGNGTIHGHEEKIKKGKNTRNKLNKPSAEGVSEL